MHKRRIVVIEGELDLGEIIRCWLVQAGFEVDVVSDGVAGLASIYGEPTDLILINEQLDQLSRYEFIRRIRQSQALQLTPIIAVVKGRSPTGEVVKAGADAVIKVPDDLSNLAPVVEMLLNAKPGTRGPHALS